MSSEERVAAVRRFSRFYTREIGLLSDGILDSPFSLTEARVIYELAQAEETTGTAIAGRLGLDPGYVSRVLRGLERRDLLTRERSAEDRRRMFLRLSASGRSAYEALNAGSHAQVARLLARVDEREQERLLSAMEAIEAALVSIPAEPHVTYRPHAPGDMGWIVQRHGELYQESHAWDDTFEAMVASIVAHFLETYDPSWERSWIAEVDGRRAGAIVLVRRSEGVAQLRLLLVEPWARGLGIGRRLVSECVGQARHAGYDSIVLFTVAGLDAARRLYEAEGFQLVQETRGHDWGHDHVAQTWELKL